MAKNNNDLQKKEIKYIIKFIFHELNFLILNL